MSPVISSVRTPAPELPAASTFFGPVDTIPLVSELIPSPIIDAAVVGFHHMHREVVTGLLQNDGRIFPEPVTERLKLFSPYCAKVRSSQEGRSLCQASDLAGLKLVLGLELTGDELKLVKPEKSLTGQATCYYCHAGCLEIVVLIRLGLLGGQQGQWMKTIGAFWGGQCHVKVVDEMQPFFAGLEQATGMSVYDWEKQYQERRQVSEGDIRQDEEALVEMAKALSTAVTDSYRLQQQKKANNQIGKFSNIIARVLKGASASKKAAAAVDRLKKMLQGAFGKFVEEYALEGSAIYHVAYEGGDGGPRAEKATPFVWSMPRLPSRVTVKKKGAESERGALEPGAPLVATAEVLKGSRLAAKIARAFVGGDTAGHALCLMPFDSSRTGQYLWVSSEGQAKRWHIGETYVQSEFAEVMIRTSERLAASLDVLSLLDETERSRRELEQTASDLEKRQEQTRTLVVSVAHLVSRPILELKIAAELLSEDPRSAEMRDHFDSCLYELRRATQNFQTFERLTGEAKPLRVIPAALDMLKVLEAAKDRIDALARLKRRPIEIEALPSWVKNASKAKARESIVNEIVDNLFHNAVKYSIGGRPVTVQVSQAEGGIEVLFTNYGCGIDADEREKVFEQEYRARAANRYELEGTGIGLWLVRRLAEAEDGKIELLSCEPFDILSKDRGGAFQRFKVVFRLWLPVA